MLKYINVTILLFNIKVTNDISQLIGIVFIYSILSFYLSQIKVLTYNLIMIINPNLDIIQN